MLNLNRKLGSPLRIAAVSALLLSAPLYAQKPSATPVGSETIELSPFEVRSESENGYAASETMTGSRIKMQIIDLPYSVNVITNEFTKDFGKFEFTDNMTEVSNFTGLDIGGNFMLRGFNSSNQLRDGFFRLGRYGSSNIDRIEIIKGSSAAIYGRTSPGGMINMISKQPKATASQELSFNYGDFGTQRVTFESGGPLLQSTLGKTNYVLTASYYQRDFDQDYSRNRNQEYYLAVSHVFGDGSKFTLSGEFFLQLRHAQTAALPLVIDQKGTATTTDDVAVGYAYNLGKYNPFGPVAELNRGNRGVTGVYEKTLNSIFSARVSGNIYGARRWDFNNNTGWGTININAPVAANNLTTTRGPLPNRGRIYEDGGGFQGDLLARYRTNNNKIEHRTLFTVDLNDYYRWDPTRSWSVATDPNIVAWNAVRVVKLDADYNPVAPLAYFPKRNFESPGEVQTRNTKRRTTVVGGGLRQQTTLLDGRLLTFAGARYDSILYRHRDFLTPAASFTPFVPGYQVGQLIRKSFNQFKPNVGLNYKITQDFRVFVNYSQSWFVNQGDNPIDIVDPTYRSESADGYDYGFKGSLLNNRLSYTLCGFYSTRQNVTSTNLVESPIGSGNFVTVTQRNGDQLVRGYEADVTWSVTKEFNLIASYGKVNSIYSDFGSAFPAALGRKVQFVAPYNGSVSVKYSPANGAWKGFSTNLGFTFVGATPTELPTAGDTYVTQAGGKRVVTSSTGQWALKTEPYSLWNLGARYRFQSKSGIAQTFAINVNNLADLKYIRGGSGGSNSRFIGEHRAIYFSYTLGTKAGR